MVRLMTAEELLLFLMESGCLVGRMKHSQDTTYEEQKTRILSGHPARSGVFAEVGDYILCEGKLLTVEY